MSSQRITHEIHVDASPEIVFDVITSPEHIREWWNGAETDLSPTPGQVAEIAWGRTGPDPHVEALTVVEADPPRLFSFRWVPDGGGAATPANSLLVTFELVPAGAGTTIRFAETGYADRTWESADRDTTFRRHSQGWDRFVPGLGDYLGRFVSTS
jgi:uncharacterized protein YndB with AHSA1/START domain